MFPVIRYYVNKVKTAMHKKLSMQITVMQEVTLHLLG